MIICVIIISKLYLPPGVGFDHLRKIFRWLQQPPFPSYDPTRRRRQKSRLASEMPAGRLRWYEGLVFKSGLYGGDYKVFTHGIYIYDKGEVTWALVPPSHPHSLKLFSGFPNLLLRFLLFSLTLFTHIDVVLLNLVVLILPANRIGI